MEEKRKVMNQDVEKLRELGAQIKELETLKVHTYNSK